jgi:error-prone DNA polymerase
MTVEERLVADYSGTGLTVDHHPLFYRRADLRREGILTALELTTIRHGTYVRTAGCVIARQRPGTAKGMMFISMDDETGQSSIIVTPAMFEQEKLVVTRSKFLAVEGRLQNEDDVIHVMAVKLWPLSDKAIEIRSHDFH